MDAGKDFARVQADPQTERSATTRLVRDEPTDRLLHRDRSADGAFGVVLVCNRRPEDGHDAVTGELVDVATDISDRIRQRREKAAGDDADPLRVELLGPRGEIGEVTKQHRDDTPFG